MKTLRQKSILLLLLCLLFNSLEVVVPTTSADSVTTSLNLSLPNDLTDWLLDEDAGYIYAISSSANDLYFIRLSDFKIEKTLNIGSNPSFIARDGQSLQIALSGATMIKTVDLLTQQISNTIITSGVPNSIAASSKYLFYGTSDRKIYKYDKATQTSDVLYSVNSFNNLILAVDELSNTLYAGKLSSYGGITAIDVETGAELSKDIMDTMVMGSSSLSLKHIFIDDRFVYFGGHQFNKENLTETTGTYYRMNNDYTHLEAVILDITDSYVLTTEGVYDKDTYSPLVLFPSNKRFAMLDSKGYAYVSGTENGYDNLSDIIRINLTIPQRTTVNLFSDSYSIRSDRAITNWTTTDGSPYIYAIVASTNELIVIRKDDMREVKRMFIGSNPSGIKVFNNKVYVMFKGENHITVIDLENEIPSETVMAKITTKEYPLDFYPDENNRILYYGEGSGGGINVTSTDYTTVTDAVYKEKNMGITGPNSYLLDQDQEILYGLDSFYLYRYNSQSFDLLDSHRIENLPNYYNSIFLDENNLYYSNRRVDANQTSILYGTYPEKIIYVRGGLVFSNNAVYDRDSFTKKIDLLMYIKNAYVGTDQTVFISTDHRLYKFNNIEEMQTKMKETRLPTNAVFVDKNLTPDRIDGYLYFEPPVDQDGIKGYAAYYLNQSGNKLDQVGTFRKTDLSTDSLFVYDIYSFSVPQGAVSIGLYPIIRLDNYIERTSDAVVSVPIYDAPMYMPVDFSVIDTNSDINKFSGTVTWKPGPNEIPNVSYYLYFINAIGPIGDELAVVNGGQDAYSVTIPEMNVPEEALGIGLVIESGNFTSPFFSNATFEDKKTPAIQASSITVNKHMFYTDTIVVNNLVAGDVIRVYNENQSFMVWSEIVKENQSTITMYISNIGDPGRKLVLTRKSINRSESSGTLVVVPAAINDGGSGGGAPGGGEGGTPGGDEGGTSGGGEGGTPGGGEGGTSGGGEGGTPGGGEGGTSGGGGIPGDIAVDPGLNDANIVTIIKENTDGTSSSMTEVTSAFISKAISEPSFKENPIVLIKADEKTATQSSQFQIDLSTILDILNKSKDATLIFESISGKLEIPVSSLSSIGPIVNGTEQKVIITISQAASDFKTRLNAQLKSPADVVLGVPMDFEVKLIGSSGQENILSDASDYIGHIMRFKLAKEADAAYAGLTYDPTTQTYVPVPTTWEWKDGVLQVTLKRKGNSVYTVVQTHVKFSDLENSNPYKESILALASRMVINGYPDGSFKAEAVVTRAEFAAMLNRAFGILPKLKASKTFKDVTNEEAWYVPQINAAVDAGLINGYTDGTFRPNQEITHQEMIVMLVNGLKYSVADVDIKENSSMDFPDKLPAWAKPYYATALDNGILTTNSPFHFQSGKATQRQESAILLYQLMKVLNLTTV